MRILAFTDTHASLRAHETLKKKAKNVDIIICAGDISIFENEIESIMSFLDSLGKKVYIIHGNHEEPGVLRLLAKESKNIIFIHRKIVQLPGLQIIGYGGDGFSRTNKDFTAFAKGLKKRLRKTKPAIMVTHQPPYDTICDRIMGEKTGNRSYTALLRKGLFTHWICGHIHENNNKSETLKGTLLLNPGPRGRVLRI
ncbi:MAG: hypothetical protein GXP63_00655 [DPANN group archaeon]|nr:hypothetical protein [DPANN group archaeon]